MIRAAARLQFHHACWAAAAVRLALVAYGEWQDRSMEVKYTDVDFWVFTEGAKHVAAGGSPYARTTYRYSPLMAFFMLPAAVWHPVLGKLLLIGSDMCCAVLCRALLLRLSPASPAARWASYVHLFNPIAINISSRGNADALICALLLLLLWLLTRGRVAAAGVCYGLAVHLRVYPIVFAPAIVWHLHARAPLPLPRGVLAGGVELARRSLSRRGVLFAAAAAGTFLTLGAACFALYGHDFLQATYLYHLTRTDHRHNFSPMFYPIYLHMAGAGGGALGRWLPLAASASQWVTLLMVAARYARDLPFAMMVQTWVFVAFNRVCTAQYFLWYLALLPLAMPFLAISKRRALSMLALWLAAEMHWLGWAYQLEMLGRPVFLQVWLAGVAFLLVNAWVVGELCRRWPAGAHWAGMQHGAGAGRLAKAE